MHFYTAARNRVNKGNILANIRRNKKRLTLLSAQCQLLGGGGGGGMRGRQMATGLTMTG
jgi:hypothetical protein